MRLAACAITIPRVLGVRDWRVIGAFLLWAPTMSAFSNADLSLPLALAVTLLWRSRDARRAPCGGLLAPKLFLWPLLVLLVVTRRVRAAALSIVIAAGLTLVTWAAIAFCGLVDYPGLVREAARIHEDDSYAVAALLRVTAPPVRRAAARDRVITPRG